MVVRSLAEATPQKLLKERILAYPMERFEERLPTVEQQIGNQDPGENGNQHDRQQQHVDGVDRSAHRNTE